MEDDVYNGYFLPKDSIILGNAWCACLTFASVFVSVITLKKRFHAQGNPTR